MSDRKPLEAWEFRYPPTIRFPAAWDSANWMVSGFTLLLRFFFRYFPIPSELQILQENPFWLLAFWSFDFPSQLEAAKQSEKMKRRIGKEKELQWAPRDLLAIPREFEVPTLYLSQPRPACFSSVTPKVAPLWGKAFAMWDWWRLIWWHSYIRLFLLGSYSLPELGGVSFSKWKKSGVTIPILT